MFSRNSACVSAPVTRFPGTVPGPCFADSHSPRPPPLAPPTPQPVAWSSFVRRLHSYYGEVRLLMIVHHRLRLLAFTPAQERVDSVVIPASKNQHNRRHSRLGLI